jgi:hypothetical protein
MQGTIEYPLDFDKPLEPKFFEIGLDGDVVMGRFYISGETILICIISKSSGGGHGSTIRIFDEWRSLG